MYILPAEHKLGEKSPTLFHGYSYGLLGSWMIFEQYGVMIDCGDGAATRATSSLGKVKDILITHSHLDHVGGLTSALNLKHRLNPNQKTKIHFPKECGERVMGALSMLGKNTQRDIILNPFEQPSSYTDLSSLPRISSVNLPKNREVAILPTRHCKGSVAYLILENRQRLKKGVDPSQAATILKEAAKKGREEVETAKRDLQETYQVILLAYMGDSPKLNEKELGLLKSAPIQMLVLEATMLNKTQFEEESQRAHSTLKESIVASNLLAPADLLLTHVSPRYSKEDVLREVKTLPKADNNVNRSLLLGENLIAL